MVDFLMISTRSTRRGEIEIYPKFIIKKSSDLMVRGGDFYAIWLEDRGLWSTEEQDVLQLIDDELDKFAKENSNKFTGTVRILHMWDAESGMIDIWHRYCQRQMRDSYHPLDDELIFSNHKTVKKDYASKTLPYPLEKGDISAYDKLMSIIYEPDERRKIEWAIGSIVKGDSKKIQKFLVLYGAAGTGKSTILNIIQQLFDGYYSVFDAKALGSSSNAFALEAFRTNPLVAIQHDGDLSRIEDNTRLNSLVSHEYMTVNEKFKATYTSRFNSFLFLGTNKPVRITDSKSGLIRRLIDVSPSGKKLNFNEYRAAMKQISFELGAIAYHCQEVYLSNPNAYDDYIPLNMLGASNDFYNYMVDNYHQFNRDDQVTLKSAWEQYNVYCEDAKVLYPLTQRTFKEELKTYFWDFDERRTLDDGTRVRNLYSKFKKEKFQNSLGEKKEEHIRTIDFQEQESIFDKLASEYPAQYANKNGTPLKKWEGVKTKLKDLDTSKLHYVQVPQNHIVVDFDITDEEGNKSLELNLIEASKFPETYSELSKSGQGIHLHYIYDGDTTMLSRIFSDEIEVKVFTGNGALRRQLSQCNNLDIATINTGLPLKKERKMVNFDGIKSEKALRTLIKRNLNKEIHPGTKPSIDFIYKILEDAYESGLNYDVSDMLNEILIFAANSTNQSEHCVKLVNDMKFKSEVISENLENEGEIIFYDVEVFPNLFIVNWKFAGEDQKVVRMINPTPTEVESLLRYRLIGFNCRRYDNHILYARLMGYTNEQLFNLSQKIIGNGKNCFFGEAYNLSYTDVYDFSSVKKSLKAFQIELGIHHQELGLPWDQPVPEDKWTLVAEYCDNDVIATEKVFEARHSDFIARQILADVAGMTVNATTNSLTTRIIFGKNRRPQTEFHYRNMGNTTDGKTYDGDLDLDKAYTMFDSEGKPIFPGYKYDFGKSYYRNELVGEGGYVYAEPGMYSDVALLDVASMHPSSIVVENLFGDEYTKRFNDIKQARIYIKKGQVDKAKNMLSGKLAKYLDEEDSLKDLSNALKIAINSVYGLTSAKFDNAFRDLRNVDNIVAKRGALFMINLKHEVQKRGYTVAHIKTDSIKIPNADEKIIDFVIKYGKLYGYDFDHEDTYKKLCLVNDAVYVAKTKDDKWTATGTQFAVPYIFKKLFSKEEIEFKDLCETKSVTTSIYLDMNENLEDVSYWENILDLRNKLEKNPDSKISKKNLALLDDTDDISDVEILDKIKSGHDYIFIGRIGSFCPIKEGCGGGILLRRKDDKYYAVTGTKGYRWLEAEDVEERKIFDSINLDYYENLLSDAITTIEKFGPLDWLLD